MITARPEERLVAPPPVCREGDETSEVRPSPVLVGFWLPLAPKAIDLRESHCPSSPASPAARILGMAMNVGVGVG